MISNQIDIAIIGGGIAGLWTLARLKKAGYQAILLEAKELACMQTGASQGIIHGGTKYALTGKLTHSAQSIQKMPQRWKACLDGDGEVDISQAKILSNHQYLWSNNNLASRLTGFFASKVMTSRMQHLSKETFLPPFNTSNFKGELYQLDEPVVDIKSVAKAIRKQFSDFVFQANVSGIINSKGRYDLNIESNTLVSAQTIILTAGVGNEKLTSSLGLKQPKMQRRPLHMPMLKAKASILPKMYAHCLGASALPKMTISSHELSSSNEIVWYLGGDIAEKGIHRSVDEQIKLAKVELAKLMPWMDFSHCQWSTLFIDRAEPKMPDGSRPSEPAVFKTEGVITAWPVKLAMVPIMVDKIVRELQGTDCKKNIQLTPIISLSQAKVSQLPWERVTRWF
jgi:hypothetical protein